MELLDSNVLLEQNMDLYGPYSELVKNGSMSIVASTINDDNIDTHIDYLFNVFSDGIDLERIQSSRVFVTFEDHPANVMYMLEDYLIQIIFWKLPVSVNIPLTTETIFWNRRTTVGYIQSYVNRIFIKKYVARVKQNNIKMDSHMLMEMNVNINEAFEVFKRFRHFQMYMNNCLVLEDTIDMMNKYKDFYDSMHIKLSGVPIQDVGRLGMQAAQLQVDYITAHESDHCLRPLFQSGEALSMKQYKEVQAHVGAKPNGEGGVTPAIIDASYMIGGLNNPLYYTIDAGASRVAQMLSHENVSRSGDFARILELNCTDTLLYPDSRYKCNTRHTITRKIDSDKTLKLYDGRYYRFRKIYADNNLEPDRVIDADKDKWLIGKTIELFSPMTCASMARGEGVCYRCYGDLAYTNFNINIGVIATELVSAKYTQKQLSAKHLLEANVRSLNWNHNIEEILEINYNTILCYDSEEYQSIYEKATLIIDTNNFDYEDENDDLEYNAFITSFSIALDGVETEYHTENGEVIYLSNDINDIMAEKLKTSGCYNEEDGAIVEIPMSLLVDCDEIFLFHIDNDELSRIVNSAKSLLNKGAVTSKFTKDEILEQFCDINLSGGFVTRSIHYEIILANQMRDADDELEYPDWSKQNVKYQIITLDRSLRNNPKVTTSLQYQKIAQQIWKPITYIKHKSSMNDLYFMKKPQEYIHAAGLLTDTTDIKSDADENINECVSFNKNLIGKYEVKR